MELINTSLCKNINNQIPDCGPVVLCRLPILSSQEIDETRDLHSPPGWTEAENNLSFITLLPGFPIDIIEPVVYGRHSHNGLIDCREDRKDFVRYEKATFSLSSLLLQQSYVTECWLTIAFQPQLALVSSVRMIGSRHEKHQAHAGRRMFSENCSPFPEIDFERNNFIPLKLLKAMCRLRVMNIKQSSTGLGPTTSSADGFWIREWWIASVLLGVTVCHYTCCPRQLSGAEDGGVARLRSLLCGSTYSIVHLPKSCPGVSKTAQAMRARPLLGSTILCCGRSRALQFWTVLLTGEKSLTRLIFYLAFVKRHGQETSQSTKIEA